jgi:2,3-bisphosphoglycerate-independent phosphoglycerate mutase
MQKKCVLILLDGIGDRAYPLFGDRTPLQAAETPVLDRISEEGANGLFHPAGLGQALPSENAHFAMFGYDLKHFPGRGALEALGAGIGIGPRDVAVLAHFSTLSEKNGYLFLENDRPATSGDEAEALFRSVGEYRTEGIDIRLIRTHGLDGIIVLSGNVSPYITDTDPFLKGRPLSGLCAWKSHETDADTRNTARALTTYLLWAYRTLKDHPVNRGRKKAGKEAANGIVTQRAGRLMSVPPFSRQWGMKGLILASGIVYHGLAAYLGMSSRKMPDTGDPGHDLAVRLHAAKNALKDFDFIHVHTKAPDEAAHAKDPVAKKAVIESLDRGIGQALRPLADDPNVLLVVTADHSTPSTGPLIHSGEPVPLTFRGPGVRRDEVKRFDEISVSSGALGCVRGKELMYLTLNCLDRSKLAGIMDTPEDQPYWPGNAPPFRVL